HQRTGTNVECADVSGRGVVLLIRRGAHDQEGLENAAGRARLLVDFLRIAIQTGAQIDPPVLAERGNGPSGLRVERLQHVAGAEEQPAVLAVLALPVVHPANVEAFSPLADPDLLSSRG